MPKWTKTEPKDIRTVGGPKFEKGIAVPLVCGAGGSLLAQKKKRDLGRDPGQRGSGNAKVEWRKEKGGARARPGGMCGAIG